MIYTFATIFMVWGVAYHYSVWLEKPPTRLYWRRTWDLLRRQGLGGVGIMTKTPSRTLSADVHCEAFTSALVDAPAYFLGLSAGRCDHVSARVWLGHFRSAPDDQMIYVTYLFGFPVGSFKIRTVLSWLIFHGLDIAAVMVLAGVFLACGEGCAIKARRRCSLLPWISFR